MSAPTYTADDFAVVFGGNYAPIEGLTTGLLIPLNALYSCAEELNVLSFASDEDHRDFPIVLIHLARRMELAAELGHGEILAFAERVAELEAKLARATGAGSEAAQ